MTAVEWLCKQYYLKQDIEIVEQAKEMEKQQQDDFAIGFAEWALNLHYKTEINKELLEIYKKEKGL